MIPLVSAMHLIALCVLGPLAVGVLVTGIVWTPQLRKRAAHQAQLDGVAIDEDVLDDDADASETDRPARALDDAGRERQQIGAPGVH